MKRFSTWLFILTFVVGVTSVFLYLKFSNPVNEKSVSLSNIPLSNIENNSSNLPIFDFCKLVKNPEKYDGKIVRLSSKLIFGLENSWFSDPECGTPNDAAITIAENKEIWNAIEQARKQKDKKFLKNEIDLIVIGKFRNEVYKDCCLIAPFQFEILQIESISKPN
jgi:hypothetical protein